MPRGDREAASRALRGISKDAKKARSGDEEERPGLMILIGMGEEEEDEDGKDSSS